MLNETPRGERIHIAFFGRRNVGKSSTVNRVCSQELSVVSSVKGTTTDPVIKSMELLPLGPVTIIDTPGIDDEGILGEKRVLKTKQILDKTDIAVLVCDATNPYTEYENDLIKLFNERNIPYIIAINKSDLKESVPEKDNVIYISALTGKNIEKLKEKIAALGKKKEKTVKLVGDFIKKDDIVILVTPIDSSAPKGRIILPQQQAIRDILDAGGINIVVKDSELETALSSLSKKPALVICDSQVFKKVSSIVPDDIPLTSFSILFARYKGILDYALSGIKKLDNLNDKDLILISEGCTHHRQCEDIGTIKLPRWIKEYTKKDVIFQFTSGGDFPSDLEKYSLIVHCGGCMLSDTEILNRGRKATEKGVPITNYGLTIAHINGILKRATESLNLS